MRLRFFAILIVLCALMVWLAFAQFDESRLKPFSINHRAAKDSPADVSFLLDPPAGKHGFVQVRNGRLAFGNGQRVRFWGVHLTDWSRGSVMLPSKDDAPIYAATLARHGVNLVRLHFLDLFAPRGIIDSTRNDSRAFDAGQLDRLDFMVAELKRRGIYVNLNLNVGRSYKEGDGVPDAEKIRWGKGLVLYNPRLIELQKEYAKALLTHRNPYTGTEYRNEPAVAIVEILNENGIGVGFRAPTPYYDNELTEIYNSWLARNRTPDQIRRLREMAGVEAGAPVPRLSGAEVAKAPQERFYTELDFYTSLEDGFYQDMHRYLRSLGVKVPIVATADHAHTSSPYPMLLSLSKLDILDGHVYWQHPGAREAPSPMVNDPAWSTVARLSRTAFAGKPYTVSETNHPFPNPWASEGIPIVSAYAAFQDWDAVVLYTFEPKRDPNWQPYMGDPYDISLDPVKMPELAAGALLFLRGDVRPAKTFVERTYTRAQVYDSRRLPATERPYFTPGFPPHLPLVHGSRIRSLESSPTAKVELALTDPIVSDTGELVWSGWQRKHGLVTVETDRTQALIGFVKAGGKTLRNLAAQISNDFAAVVLTSLDAQPLSRTSRMLLVTGARVANTGMKWNEDGTQASTQGGPPSMTEPVTGTVLLKDLQAAKAVAAQPLDGAGSPLGQAIPGKQTQEGWSLAIGDPVTPWYVIRVER